MSDSPFELSIDSDWKKQAQAEKKRLAEEAASRKEKESATPAPSPAAPSSRAPASSPAKRPAGDVDFKMLVRSVGDQALMYLGAIPVGEDGRGIVDLDAARRQIDLLSVLESKTAGNLDDTEQSSLDLALYESRSRFASVASRYIL